jgi:hypothetical protein
MALFPRLHHPADAKLFPRALVSVNTRRRRKGPLEVNAWLMDSGALTQIRKHGGYTESPAP